MTPPTRLELRSLPLADLHALAIAAGDELDAYLAERAPQGPRRTIGMPRWLLVERILLARAIPSGYREEAPERRRR